MLLCILMDNLFNYAVHKLNSFLIATKFMYAVR